MYYTEKIQLHQAETLLGQCGLSVPEGVELTVGVFDDSDGRLVATGSLKGDMIQGIAVDPASQGEDLTARVLTALIGEARDAQSLYLFTKPAKAHQFTGLGFRLIAEARPYAALLEWGQDGVRQYLHRLEEVRRHAGLLEGASVGALVMNCNPFTLGHRYLIEQAAKQCEQLLIFVVQEDKSFFPYNDRIELVRQGVQDLPNVSVVGSGKFIISSLTFQSYFNKAALQDRTIDCSDDVTLFVNEIAPAANIKTRFVGEEPLDQVTNQYNRTLEKILPMHGIRFVEIPRITTGDNVISASRVRQLLQEKNWDEIKRYVPETTLRYLEERFG